MCNGWSSGIAHTKVDMEEHDMDRQIALLEEINDAV